MKTLEDFTPEIQAKIPEYQEKAVKELYNGTENKNWKRENTVEYIEYVYALAKQEHKPVVVIANTLKEYKLMYNIMFNEQFINNDIFIKLINLMWIMKNRDTLSKTEIKAELNSKLSLEKYISELANDIKDNLNASCLTKDLLNEISDNELKSALTELKNFDLEQQEMVAPKRHWLFLTVEYSRVYLMWYKFIKDEFKIETSKKDVLDWLYDHVNGANIAKTFLCKKVVLVLRMPERIKRNEIGFHSVSNEGAIVYNDQKMHYINGRKMPDWIFDKYFSKTLEFEDFIKETNEDVKAGIITLIKENEGNEGLLKFLKAELIDAQTLVHEDGYLEEIKLYKTKEKYSFLQDRNGNRNVPYAWTEMICPSTKQSYLIDTCSSFTSALESIKFHRPSRVPQEVDYKWMSAN